MNSQLKALRDVRDVLNGKDNQETARRMCNAIIARELAKRDAMTADEKLIMDLATPATVDDAARLLRHPLEQAQAFAEARQMTQPENAEFWRRLAGSIRKARGMV